MVTPTTKPVYVAFYTRDTPYEAEADKLRENLEQFDLDYEMTSCTSTGSWECNTQLKAGIILEALYEHKRRPVVYLDVDARIEQYPVLFDNILCDISFHYFRGVELLSGTLFFGNHTPIGAELVKQWRDENDSHPGQWDQRTLQKVVEARDDLDILPLPETYVYINHLSVTNEKPVIRHTQASRQHKRVINGRN